MVFSGTSIWLTSIIIYQLFLQDNIELLGKTLIVCMDVSENRGTPKSSILIRFSIINHPFWGTPIFGNTHIRIYQIGSFVRSWFNFFLPLGVPIFLCAFIFQWKMWPHFQVALFFENFHPYINRKMMKTSSFRKSFPWKTFLVGNEGVKFWGTLPNWKCSSHVYISTWILNFMKHSVEKKMT